MDKLRNISPLTDLDETVEHLLPHPRISSLFYSILLAATLLLSVLSVIFLLAEL
jgi:hypothetical protein